MAELLSGEAIKARVEALEEGVLELELRREAVVAQMRAAQNAGETATAMLLLEVLQRFGRRVSAWQ